MARTKLTAYIETAAGEITVEGEYYSPSRPAPDDLPDMDVNTITLNGCELSTDDVASLLCCTYEQAEDRLVSALFDALTDEPHAADVGVVGGEEFAFHEVDYAKTVEQ